MEDKPSSLRAEVAELLTYIGDLPWEHKLDAVCGFVHKPQLLDGKFHGRVFRNRDGREEQDFIVFVPRDMTLPDLLEQYERLCRKIGAKSPQLRAVSELRERVRTWQLLNAKLVKIPDKDQADRPRSTKQRWGGYELQTTEFSPGYVSAEEIAAEASSQATTALRYVWYVHDDGTNEFVATKYMSNPGGNAIKVAYEDGLPRFQVCIDDYGIVLAAANRLFQKITPTFVFPVTQPTPEPVPRSVLMLLKEQLDGRWQPLDHEPLGAVVVADDLLDADFRERLQDHLDVSDDHVCFAISDLQPRCYTQEEIEAWVQNALGAQKPSYSKQEYCHVVPGLDDADGWAVLRNSEMVAVVGTETMADALITMLSQQS